MTTQTLAEAQKLNSVQKAEQRNKLNLAHAIEISVLSKETVIAMHNKVLLANAVFLKAKKKRGESWRDDIIASVSSVKKVVDGYNTQLENEGYYVLAHRPDGQKALKQLKNNTKVAEEIYRAMLDTGSW